MFSGKVLCVAGGDAVLEARCIVSRRTGVVDPNKFGGLPLHCLIHVKRSNETFDLFRYLLKMKCVPIVVKVAYHLYLSCASIFSHDFILATCFLQKLIPLTTRPLPLLFSSNRKQNLIGAAN